MNRRHYSLLGLAGFLLWAGSARAAGPSQPTGTQAAHRSGQTFVTWTERGDLAGERYRVYRYGQPITAATLGQADRLREVAEGSGRFLADRYRRDDGIWQARYFDRFVIQDHGAQLSAGTGLLVWTLAPADFAAGDAGPAYYAVTTVSATGAENISDFGPGNTAGPVLERVDDPLPVETSASAGAGGRVFIQYMDLRHWNPTFHAPNPFNEYLGLDQAEPWVAGAIQYAYSYVVYDPDLYCDGQVPARAPVVISLHGWSGDNYPPLTEIPDPWWCAFKIYPTDFSQTWFFGFARDKDFRQGGEIDASDTIVNYTEQRLLRMIYDLQRHPLLGSRVDPERIYIYGHSMGGSGALAFALRYPGVFAAAYASEPMTNYRTVGDGGGTDWRGDLAWKWGTPGQNLPVRIQGPGHWADPLQEYNGTGIWDWQNHQANARSRLGNEMVPLGFGHGLNDTAIEWPTQGRPAYPAFNSGRRMWGGAVTTDEHSWLSFAGLPPTLGGDESLTPFAGLQAIRSEAVPGLSNGSGDSPLPPAGPGGFNQDLDWSASWNPWDGAPIDTPASFRISLRATGGASRTVDITPRRLQHLRITPGAGYSWENRRSADGSLVASGTAWADARGVLTIPFFQVTPAGNRLLLGTATPGPRAWPGTRRGVRVFNDQLTAGMNAALIRFSATRYAGTQKMTRVEADRLRAVNPGFLILHYRLGAGLGYRAAGENCQPAGDYLQVIEGDNWVQEWPGAAQVQENWFFHWPETGGVRVFNCDWGWYLMELNQASFRQYWQNEVLRQIQANDDDGVFMDSLSVPNYLGYDHYAPPLPAVDDVFEDAWANKISAWLEWLQGQPLSRYHVVPNMGSWITSRETTDYGAADGLMIEGFAMDADQSPYALEDWQLQMNRILQATRLGQAIMAQTYVTGGQERLFTAGCYFLVKEDKTYLNLELGLEPEWWPEYDLPLGAPSNRAVRGIQDLDADGDNVYRRDFDNGFVLVNPTNPWDGSGVTRTLPLGGTYYLAQPAGGGEVPADGVPTSSIGYLPVNQVTLPPFSAAVLMRVPSTGDLDWDGRANLTDLVILGDYLAHSLAHGTAPFTAPLAMADIHPDGAVNAADLSALAKTLAGD